MYHLLQNSNFITKCVGALDKSRKFCIKFGKTCDKIENMELKSMHIWFSLNY